MKYTFERVMERAKADGSPLWSIFLSQEQELSGLTRDQIFAELGRRYEIMYRSAHAALNEALPTAGNLISGMAKTQQQYAKRGNTLCGRFLNRVMAYALSCSEANAAMHCICACPTAGSCGIVPAVLCALEDEFGFSRQEVLRALLVASGFGAVVMDNATAAGPEGGCQAECGVAGAMAAAGAVSLMDGTAQQCMDAFCIAMMNVMGLVCDPIAGLVQIPCAQRNASQAVNALLSADLALGGMQSPVSADEMVEVMRRVGKEMPRSLRETAEGGMAATRSAKAIEAAIYQRGGGKELAR